MYRLFLSFLFVSPFLILAQDIEAISKFDKNSVKVSGGLNFNTTGFLTDNKFSTRDPLSWFASGNINISAAGMSFPFTYSISNQSKNFSQPSNITALHPTYKWVKTHFGRTSMSFSPYTLSGINFSGVGLELTPKRITFKAMYGQLNKAIEYDAQKINTFAFERWAYSFMVIYKLKKTTFTVISIKAKDKLNSVSLIPGSISIKAKDNLVTSFGFQTTLFKRIDLNSEVSTSMLTNNVRNTESVMDDRWFTIFYPLISGNGTTSTYKAYKGGISYQLKHAKFGFSYERIDPNYQTLGGLYFTNDLENFTFNPSLSLFKNKINLAFNTGLQRNNLDQQKASQTKRWVGSVNLNMQLIKGLTSTLSYSNFSAFTRNNPLLDPFSNQMVILDTCNVYQISENVSSNLTYGFGEKNKQSIGSTFTYQISSNVTGQLENAGAFGINASGNSKPFKSYVNTMNYNYSLAEKKVTFGINLNSNYSVNEQMKNLFCGPSLSISKSFGANKPLVSGGLTYNRNYQNNVMSTNVFNYRLGYSLAPKLLADKYGKFNLGFNAMYLLKLPTVQSLNRLNEFTIIANISYNFN
jgi:hypothetical protein